MATRPLVSVFGIEKGEKVGEVAVPTVLNVPIRPDVVSFVHDQISKNKRQAYAVNDRAGEQTSAISWGTGRAVARIPRVSGGGTSRAGQGAFGNMCRKGRMFAPTKVIRRWHRHVNINQKRYALVSALAASAIPALVMARGHAIGRVAEVPLVVADAFQAVNTTKKALAALAAINASGDVAKSKDSKKIRAGRGKSRNRRYVIRRGPLVVYSEDNGLVQALRNLPGVDVANVERLNLLRLAPGGHLGRFVIWTQSAFTRLQSLYGSYVAGSSAKKDYILPRPLLSNSDLTRVINSEEVQSKLWEKKTDIKYPARRNPLTNKAAMDALNPYAATARAAALAAAAKNADLKAKKVKKTADQKKAAKAAKKATAALRRSLEA